MNELVNRLADALRRTNRIPGLVLVPIVLDALALWAGWTVLGGFVRQEWSVRVILEVGLPSISHVMERPLLANTLPFVSAAQHAGAAAAVFAAFLAASCFAQGGYIGALYEAASGGRFRTRTFVRTGARSFLRLLLLYVTVQIAKLAVTLTLAAVAGVAGVFFALVAFVALRVTYIFLEFVIVVERTDLIGALGRARELLMASWRGTLVTVAALYAVSGAVSAGLHRVASPAGLLAVIVFYAYAMTWIHIALMRNYVRARADTE